MRIYLDANFFIRFVESRDPILMTFFEQAVARDLPLITSELTLLETLTGAVRDADDVRISAFEQLLDPDTSFVTVLPIDRTVLRKAAEVRVDLRNKTPDAIHVATAEIADCTVFVSSDKKLNLPEGTRRILLEDLEGLS